MSRALVLCAAVLCGIAPIALKFSVAWAQPLGAAAALPPIAAKGWILFDYQAARELAAFNRDERVEPASLTKLMDAYLVFAAIRQGQLARDQGITVSAKAKATSGSRMYLSAGQPVTIDELLHGMIVQSGNDATIALAEAAAGSEEIFVQRMNEQAARMGLAGTHFANVTGLPDTHHYSTAGDLLKLAVRLMREYPEYLPMFALHEYTYAGVTQRNRNELLFRDPYVDGLKTGHTESAGYCLIATARRNDRRLIAIVMGTASETARAIEAQKLLNYGFEHFETFKLYAKDAPVVTLPVWKGSEDHLEAGFVDDFFVSVPKGQGALLKAKLESLQPLLAPIAAQQPVGVLRLSYADKPYGEFPVVALERVGVANLFVRAWHSLRLLFK
jgi:serine-type D-Ala-D-Ala carboxypeptidase (penicillin-binding protein 5/6)